MIKLYIKNKNFIFLIAFIAIIASVNIGCDETSKVKKTRPTEPRTTNVSGRTFIGDPSTAEFVKGCEGCSNPGEFSFIKGNSVCYAFPGSDIEDCDQYTQEGLLITFKREGAKFTVSEDGWAIRDEYGTIYRDKEYGW